MEINDRHRELFAQLVAGLHMEAAHFLGRMAHPVTGKKEKNLEGAQNAIDMLDMLNTRMGATFSDEEREFLTHVLKDLRLIYVEEAARP